MTAEGLWNFAASATTSLIISGIGWCLLERRANKSAKRSETFSLIAPSISLLSDIQELAESYFNAQADGCSNLHTNQVLEIKFHTKFDLLRTKFAQLEYRDIRVKRSQLIELRQAYTLHPIDSAVRYQNALECCLAIETELYDAFERRHNGKYKKST